MDANNLKLSTDVYNFIKYRLSLIPKDSSAFLDFFRLGWPGKEDPEPWECQWQYSDCGFYLIWLNKWDETIANQAIAAGEAILGLYYSGSTPAPVPSPITQPTTTPTLLSPSSDSCIDSTLRFKLRKGGKIITRDCIWVSTKPYRCTFYDDGVASHCPKTCNQCSICEDATNRFMFQLNGKKRARDCKWVETRATLSRCKKNGVRSTCRKTCGEC